MIKKCIRIFMPAFLSRYLFCLICAWNNYKFVTAYDALTTPRTNKPKYPFMPLASGLLGGPNKAFSLITGSPASRLSQLCMVAKFKKTYHVLEAAEIVVCVYIYRYI